MNIDETGEMADIAIAIWPPTTLISHKTVTPRTHRRRRAKARATWPQYLPEVAYRIEGLPPPRRPDLGTARPRQLSRQFPAWDSAVGL